MTNKEFEERLKQSLKKKSKDTIIELYLQAKFERDFLQERLEAEKEKQHGFKVGDRVQFKSWEEMKAEFGLNEFGDIDLPNEWCFNKDMKNLCGTYATIKSIEGNVVRLENFTNDKDHTWWRYTLDMLKPATDEPKYKYKVGDVVEYPRPQDKLPDVGTITEIYSSVGYVEVENNNDKTLAEVKIKDIKPYTRTKCFNIGDKVKIKNKKNINFGSIATILDVPKGQEKHYEVKFETQIPGWFLEKDLEPYTEPRWTFTDDEKVILRNLPERYKWIARDAAGRLFVYYVTMPHKDENCNTWTNCDGYYAPMFVFKHLFQSIKWEDTEACEFRKYL